MSDSVIDLKAVSELIPDRVKQVTQPAKPERNIRIAQGLGLLHMEAASCNYERYFRMMAHIFFISTEYGINISTLS
jgi:hypothetical protein